MKHRAIVSLAAALSVLLATQVAGAAGRVSIQVPETVDEGARVTVEVANPREGGRLEIWGPITGADEPGQLGAITGQDGVFALTAPARAGSYQLRYVGPNGRTLARAGLEVAALPLVLRAPERVFIGQTIQTVWSGPADPGDALRLVDPATGAVVAEVPAEGAANRVSVATLPTPDRPGAYEIRYWSAAGRTYLRALPIEVRRTAWPEN